MKVSIVTVVYNNKECIADCIRSVLGQTYRDIEHIVIDGGSTDGTQEAIAPFVEQLACYVSEKDRGLYDALNKGVRMATGEVIGVLHSDDLFYAPDTVEKVVQAFQDSKADIVYANGMFVDSQNTDKVKRIYPSKTFKKIYLAFGWIPLHTTMYIKKEVYRKHGLYRTDYDIASDYDLSLRFFENKSIKKHFLKAWVVKMRLGGKSTSMSLQKKKSKEDLNIIHEHQLNGSFTLFFKVTRKIAQYLLPRIIKFPVYVNQSDHVYDRAGGSAKYLPLIAVSIDILLLFNSFLTAGYFVFRGNLSDIPFFYLIFTGWVALWFVLAMHMKLYDMPRILYQDRVLEKNLKALSLFFLICAALIYFLDLPAFPKSFFLIGMSIFSLMMLVWHAMLISLFKGYRRNGNNYRNIAVVGFKEPAEQLLREVLMAPENGFRLTGIFANEAPPEDFRNFYRGGETDLLQSEKGKQPEELLIALPGHQSGLINEYMRFADNHMIRVHLLPNFSGYLHQKFSIDYLENIPVLALRREPLESISNRMMKRIFDLIFASGILLFIGTWLFPLLALLIKLGSPGPVFFVQKRSGKNGKPFDCYKFRSMKVNQEADLKQATANDDRVTPLGRFLRKTSMDELPQFINVLQNHMSVVGPRPHMLNHTEAYLKIVDKYMVRHFAKPGITGLAQVRGFRGEIRTDVDIIKRAEADIWYIENWNIFLDLKIILLTLWQVVLRKEKNAY